MNELSDQETKKERRRADLCELLDDERQFDGRYTPRRNDQDMGVSLDPGW